MPRRRTSACLSAALLLTLAGCAGGSTTGSASSPSGTPSPTTAVSTTATPSVAPSTAAPSPAPRPATPPRTSTQLAKGLLALADLPAGFAIDKSDGSGDDGGTLSAKDAKCAKLVAYSNADTPPGSKASATESFSGGSDGPFIDESLDAMGSTAAVGALQKSFKQAITSCRAMTLSIPGQGRSPITVQEVAPPKAGTNPVAVRFTATSGPLEGLEVTMITTGVADVVLGITVVAGDPDTIEGATAAAVHKAQTVLGSEA